MNRKFYTLLFFLFCILEVNHALGPWTQKCSMSGLGRHLAFSMSVGSRGYVGGGWNGVSVYYDFWEYDPGTNSWTQKANLPAMMWSNPAFGLGTAGYVACAGNTYRFDPAANNWSVVNNAAPYGTYMEEAKFIINGKAYTIDQNYIYEFDPQNFQWTLKYTLPASNFACDAAFAIGNKGYFIDNYYMAFYEYDPAANTLTPKTTCPGIMTDGIAFTVNNKGYAGLGRVITQTGPVQEMYEYDASSDNWKRINDFEGAARRKATAFAIGTRAYITCGSSGINMNDLWEFDNSKATGMDEENTMDGQVKIFPNPSADGKFYIETPAKAVSACVYDLRGNLLKTVSLKNNTLLDMSGWGNGLYLLSLVNTSGETLLSEKIILAE